MAVAGSDPVASLAYGLALQLTACVLLLAESRAFRSVASVAGTNSDPGIQLFY